MPKLLVDLAWGKDKPLDLTALLYTLEKEILIASLKDQNYSPTCTAKLLKLSRQSLYHKRKRFELDRQE